MCVVKAESVNQRRTLPTFRLRGIVSCARVFICGCLLSEVDVRVVFVQPCLSCLGCGVRCFCVHGREKQTFSHQIVYIVSRRRPNAEECAFWRHQKLVPSFFPVLCVQPWFPLCLYCTVVALDVRSIVDCPAIFCRWCDWLFGVEALLLCVDAFLVRIGPLLWCKPARCCSLFLRRDCVKASHYLFSFGILAP